MCALSKAVEAIRRRLWELDYKAESLGGYKVKEIAAMFSVMPARVQYWVEKKMLLTKGGRITDRSLSQFLVDFPEKIPYESLSADMRNWLREMGYPAAEMQSNSAGTGSP